MPFRFDTFTIKAQEAVQAAVELAAERGNPQVTPVHLLRGLVAEREGIVRPLLEKIGVDRGHLERIIEAELSHLPKVQGGAQPQPDQELVKVFDTATALCLPSIIALRVRARQSAWASFNLLGSKIYFPPFTKY
jgi:ATP-dependent Clp protease ATP-binding subunit ClpB